MREKRLSSEQCWMMNEKVHDDRTSSRVRMRGREVGKESKSE